MSDTPNRRTEFVAVHLTKPVRDKIRRATLDISVAVGRKVSMSDALDVALDVASENPKKLASKARTELTHDS